MYFCILTEKPITLLFKRLSPSIILVSQTESFFLIPSNSFSILYLFDHSELLNSYRWSDFKSNDNDFYPLLHYVFHKEYQPSKPAQIPVIDC